MSDRTELTLAQGDYDKAFTEVSFLLDVLTRTIGQVVGSASTSMAVSAGRHMAKKLPLALGSSVQLEDALAALQDRLEAGFDITFSCTNGKADLKVGRCAVREVCSDRGMEIGGELCVMLHNFWAGMLAELHGVPVRSKGFTAGDTCTISMG